LILSALAFRQECLTEVPIEDEDEQARPQDVAVLILEEALGDSEDVVAVVHRGEGEGEEEVSGEGNFAS
jgi:hypothetical protein